MKPEQKKNNDLNLQLDPEVAKGIYSNLVVISHSPTEIILDFAQVLPGIKDPSVRSRVIMDPVHAKRLLMALNENINKYEHLFGTITEPQAEGQQGNTIPFDMIPQGNA